MVRSLYRSPLLFPLLVLVSSLSRSPGAEDAEGAAGGASLADAALRQIEGQEGTRFWATVAKLEALGEEAVPVLEKALAGASEKARLAAASAILHIEGEEADQEAIAALKEMARGAKSKEARIAAIEILGQEGDPDDVLPVLDEVFNQTVDAAVAIPLARALWEIDRVAKARDRLVDLLGSKDLEVKQAAALALAEIDYFEGDVREVLRSLKKEPTARGRRAADLDRILKLSRQLDRGVEQGEVLLEGADAAKLVKIKEQRIRELEDKLERGAGARRESRSEQRAQSPEDALLDEVILQIQNAYVDESKTDRKNLILGAVRGMVRSLDEFSSFMEVDDTKSFTQSMSGEYIGIGAYVNKSPDQPLEIAKPQYKGPAHEAGILTGDKILAVDGVETDKLQIEDLTEKLQGEPGSKVTLKVFRRGWDEARDFVLERRTVEVPSVYYEVLPGKIGYLHLQQFGDKSTDEFIAALDALEKEGIAGLILDVRNNPGGKLDAAKAIADQFLAGELPIYTQKGRGKSADGAEVSTFPDPFKRPGYPLVVLVNQRSASASEIIAGALQDHGRATLVGKKTFGKGTVQSLYPLSNEAKKVIGGEGVIRLTVRYYFLPLGRCVHTIRDANGLVLEEGGVKPDIDVEADKIPAWRAEERERLRSIPALVDYVDKQWPEIKKLFVDGDGRDAGKYPAFDELFKALDTPVPRDDVRSLIRYHVRRRLEDERGKEFACDFQEDVQLQRAILEILKKLGEKPESYPRYAFFEAR